MNVSISQKQLKQLRALLSANEDLLTPELLELHWQIAADTSVDQVAALIQQGYSVSKACDIVTASYRHTFNAESLRRRFYKTGLIKSK